VVVTLSYDTLAIVNAPTLSDGLVQLLRIGDALAAAGRPELGCGVIAWRDADGHVTDAHPWRELPPGVIETIPSTAPDPWETPEESSALPEDSDNAARRELLELLAHINPDRDLLATADGVAYLGLGE
jgi:hypothetical protein